MSEKGQRTLGKEKGKSLWKNPAPASQGAQSSKGQIFWAIVACFALPFIIYSNTLHAPFLFDDHLFIVDNPEIRQIGMFNERTFKARALTFWTFALNYHFGKLNTFGYHLFNVSVHVFITILIFTLTRLIVFLTFGIKSIILPLLVALMFAAHPINTEVVTHISRRSDSIATFFYLASLLFFTSTVLSSKKYYPFSLIFFICSLFSKEIASTLPAIILIFDFLFLSQGNFRFVYSRKYYHLPYWIILAVYLFFTHFHLGGIGADHSGVTAQNWTAFSYFTTQLFVILKYIQLLFVPIGQCIDHLIHPAKTIFNFKTIFSFLAWVVLSVFLFVLCKKNKPLSKLIIFSALWFLITLTPTSSFLPIGDAMTERRLYLPAWGFQMLLLSLYLIVFKTKFTTDTIQKNEGLQKGNTIINCRPKLLFVIMVVHVILLSRVTWKRNEKYKNPILLWEEAMVLYPHNPRAYDSLGVLYFEQKNYSRSIELLQAAIQVDDKYLLAYYNLGNAYYKLRDFNNALLTYKKMIEPHIPLTFLRIDAVYRKLGDLYHMQNKYSEALQYYQKVIEVNPNDTMVYNNIGSIYSYQKEYAKAIKIFEKAVQLYPNNLAAIRNLGRIYYERKEFNKALEYFHKAVELDPNLVDAHEKLGILFYKQKKYDKALKESEIVLKLRPNDQLMYENVLMLRQLIKSGN